MRSQDVYPSSDYGNFAHRWNRKGTGTPNIAQFLLTCDTSYLLGKFAAHEFDVPGSLEAIKKSIANFLDLRCDACGETFSDQVDPSDNHLSCRNSECSGNVKPYSGPIEESKEKLILGLEGSSNEFEFLSCITESDNDTLAILAKDSCFSGPSTRAKTFMKEIWPDIKNSLKAHLEAKTSAI